MKTRKDNEGRNPHDQTDCCSKPSHTPTPWRIAANSENNDFIIEDHGAVYIASVTNEASDVEAKANADFIVKACNANNVYEELVRAAKKALEDYVCWEYGCPNGGWEGSQICNHNPKESMKNLNGAIAKAEGK